MQSVVMNGSGLIVDAPSLLVAMYPFGMSLVDRIYESAFCNLRVRFNVLCAFNLTITHEKGRVCN